MNEKKETGLRVAKKCPQCDLRIFDKITPGSGMVEVKCPRCKTVFTLDLAYRRMSPSCYTGTARQAQRWF